MLIVRKHCLSCYRYNYVWENSNGISVGTVDMPCWTGAGQDIDSAIFNFIDKAPDEITLWSNKTDPVNMKDTSLEFDWIEVNGINCCIYIMWYPEEGCYHLGGGFCIGEVKNKDKDEGKKELIKKSEKEIKRIQRDFKKNKEYNWFNLTLFFITDSENPDKIAILEPERGIFAQLGAETIILNIKNQESAIK